jgi:hypothetical protein
MDKTAIKQIIYGGLEELLSNNRFYYHSQLGEPYSHFTDEGRAAILAFLEAMAFQIRKAEEEDLDRRAKEQVLQALKN